MAIIWYKGVHRKFFNKVPHSRAKAKRSNRWKYIRLDHIKNFPQCAACGSTLNLEVHHKLPVNLYPWLALDKSNLVTLCGHSKHSKGCHLTIGHLGNWKSYNSNL